jgi:UDP-glucose 4-epimerase
MGDYRGVMRVLITGGSGFIGSHLAESFQGEAEVRVLDDLATGHAGNLSGLEVDFRRGSILDGVALEGAMVGVDYVFHLAAMVSVPVSVHEPVGCEELNGMGVVQVLEAAARAGVKKVFFASSAAVYGDNPVVPKLESMLPEPKSPYAITKLQGEFWCRFFHDEGKVETAALRFFNVFGPRQDPRGAYAAAVPIFIEKALKGEPITIYGDGSQTRDFIYVKDIVAAIRHVTLTPGLTGVRNAGYGGMITVRDLAEKIVALAGSKSEIRYLPERAGDVKHSRAAVEALAATGFVPVSNLEAGLAATLAYFRGR